MKNRLGLIFIILAILIVAIIFYFLNPNTLHKENTDTKVASQAQLSKEALAQFFSENSWADYANSDVRFNKQDFDNKKVYIHLWASWCAPCVNEVPELIEFAHKSSKDIKFITISLDDNVDDLSKFLISFPEFNSDRFIKIFDKDKKASKFINADRLPMTIIVNNEEGSSQVKEIRSVVDWKNLVVN